MRARSFLPHVIRDCRLEEEELDPLSLSFVVKEEVVCSLLRFDSLLTLWWLVVVDMLAYVKEYRYPLRLFSTVPSR